MEEEIKNLEYTLEKYSEVIEDSNLKLNHLKELFKFDYDAYLEEKFKLEAEIKALEKAKLVPYFARIDFKNDKHFDKCYIGKKGVSDYDNNIITVDWRAPISSLYYDSNVGYCSYEAPEGTIDGDLLLKRQYTIENSKLINFNDVDTVSNDELLKPYLSVSADNRLKNIVSTIQSEQNKIIREKLGKDLVIQGVAGSGKTTVALHRIAYLVYNNREIYKPSDYMVIGPNKFFVSYISSILPDLDVNGVTQNTLDELFENYVNEKFIINNSLDILKESDEIAQFKVSMEMKKEIDNYFKKLDIIPDKNLETNGIKLITNNKIRKIYETVNKKIFKSISSQVDRLKLLIEKEINDNFDTLSEKLIHSNISKKTINSIKENLNVTLNKYFSITNQSVKKIYIEVLTELNYDCSNIKNNQINIEDIPSMLYIKYKMSGSRCYDNYKHIVIDEAQDYGEFTFYALKKLFKNSTFSIYGDLAQSLYPYRSITNWESLDKIYHNFEILKLNKSYRTTIEIMNEANKINELLHLDKAIPVIRHGEDVEYFTDAVENIINKIKNKYNTIAIITKTQESANEVYQELKNSIDLNLITSSNLNYDKRINVLPSYLSKGLEFDAVILLGEDDFDRNNILDMKLLYVSKTRALHKLFIKRGKNNE